MWNYVLGVLGTFTILISSVVFGVICLLRSISNSVGKAGPTPSQLRDEKHDTHALFRYLPQLKATLAWRALGQFPTPIHKCEMTTPSGQRVTFSVKREDLCSPLYGGNKVRTLQHSLAVIEARYEKEHGQPVLVMGSGGSNQVVASLVHGSDKNLKFSPLWARDEPDFDNTLNMLSTLSYAPHSNYVWGSLGHAMQGLRALISTSRSKHDIVTPPGGNTPAGVMGQISGLLELAEQIEKGEIADVDAIYLPIGSSCTISGLILGVALARSLNLKAFRKPSFTIVGTIVHHGFALMQRLTNHHKRGYSVFMPLSIRYTIHNAARLLQEIGGPYLEASAIQILQENVRIVADKDVVGQYGTHSVKSLPAADAYDRTGTVVDAGGKPAPPLWICGHFVSKALCVLLKDLEQNKDAHFLLWQTKSAVLPKGNTDEFKAMGGMPTAVLDWAKEGKAYSTHRPGSFDINKSAATYRERFTTSPVTTPVL